MKHYKGTRCGLKLAVLYFHFIVNSAFVVDFEKFTRWTFENIRVDNVDATFYNKSILQCALICTQFHGGCVSFNIHPSGSCEINTKPFSFFTVAYLNQPSWSLYEKGDCGLGKVAGHHCLMLPIFSHGFSWMDSKERCMKGHANLVKVANETEMQLLNHELNNVYSHLADWGGTLWTGLNKIGRTDFMWADMTTLEYSNFTFGEPNLAHDCVSLTNFQSNWVWKTLDCSTHLAYVCERRNFKF